MAITYQKAVNVDGTGASGEKGENKESEHYNKLARAFNERLLYGLGDPTWRLFFSAHSMMRSMVKMKPGFNSENAWQEPTQEDAWWKIYSHIIPSPKLYEDRKSVNYRDSYEAFSSSAEFSGTIYSWPSGKIGRFKGPNAKNPLVAYIYGTAGGLVDWFYNEDRLPPEWFRAQLVKLEIDLSAGDILTLKDNAAVWVSKAENGDSINSETEDPVSLVDSFMYYDSEINPKNDQEDLKYDRSPNTLAKSWLLAKVQRGVVVPAVNNSDIDMWQFRSAMTHAAAPAYMTARWYYDYYLHHRSPHGKTPPFYEPSPSVVGLCPWRDRKFPPIPIHEYIFSPVNPDTHNTLRFKTGCAGGTSSSLSGKIYKVRREYDHYLLIFWDGHYTDPITKKRRHGNMKLPYKHYFEGPYEGGGKLAKREAEKDMIDSALNFYNSTFRKHFSANFSKEIFSKYLVETDKGVTGQNIDFKYKNLSEATCDVPTWGFEFQDFFEKQYSLAPAIGKVNWKDSWERQDGESEFLYEPEYPSFGFLNFDAPATSNHNFKLAAGTTLDIYRMISRPEIDTQNNFAIKNSYGTEKYGLFASKIIKQDSKFYPDKDDSPKIGSGGSRSSSDNWSNYCIAGYFLVGAGLRVTIDSNGAQNPQNVQLNLKEYKNSDSSTSVLTHEVIAPVNTVEGSGFCGNIDTTGTLTDGNVTPQDYSTQSECTDAGYTWIMEGVFQKMHYFAKSKEVILSNRNVTLSSHVDYVFLDSPNKEVATDDLYKRSAYGSNKVLSSNSWSGISMEMAVLLRMKPDLPDAMLLLRLASTGFGTESNVSVDLGERLGEDAKEITGKSSLAFRPDTKGDMLPTTYGPDGKPDITKSPQTIWRNYNNYGIIKNLWGRNNLAHRTTESGSRVDSESYTKRSMDENIAAGGEAGEVGNKDLPINFNPLYESAREMYHRNLRMIPRTRLQDYRVIKDESGAKCVSYNDKGDSKILDDIENEVDCLNLNNQVDSENKYNWVGTKEKSELTFLRYVDMYEDPNLPDMAGVHEETLHEKVYNPNVIEPETPGDTTYKEPKQ